MKQFHRRSIRLSGFNYSAPGYYFVTICIRNKENKLGSIIDKKLQLNNFGRIVENSLNIIQEKFKNVKIYTYMIMPNHVHIIFQLLHSDCRGVIYHSRLTCINKNIKGLMNQTPTKTLNMNKSISLPEIVRYLKARTTRIIRTKNPNIYFEWQRNYYERIIRNKRELFKYNTYIKNNPKNWKNDEYFLS